MNPVRAGIVTQIKAYRWVWSDNVDEISLFAGSDPGRVKFSKVVDAAWLKENGYKVVSAGKAHGLSYALYKLCEELSFGATLFLDDIGIQYRKAFSLILKMKSGNSTSHLQNNSFFD
jgi:hypothetical protein